MKLKTRSKIERLTPNQEKIYEARKKLSKEISQVRKRLSNLEEDRGKCDAKLAPVFEQTGNVRKLSDGTIVTRKVIDIDDIVGTKAMVGKIIRSGYSYLNYSESAGKE
jgi:hypothetical protein